MGEKPNFLPNQQATQNWLIARNMFEKNVTNRLEFLTKIQLHLAKKENFMLLKCKIKTPTSNAKWLKKNKNWELDRAKIIE